MPVGWLGPQREGLLRVLSDYDEGGRMAARCLHEKGHRRVLLLNTPGEARPSRRDVESYEKGDSFDRPEVKSLAFLKEWTDLGGRWDRIAPVGWDARMARFDEEDLLAHFQGSDPCTAAFAVMDTLAFGAQQVLSEREPEPAGTVEFVGYYDTPWSEAGHPPFTSVSLRLEELAARACRMIGRTLRGEPVEETTQVVEPRLVRRGP